MREREIFELFWGDNHCQVILEHFFRRYDIKMNNCTRKYERLFDYLMRLLA